MGASGAGQSTHLHSKRTLVCQATGLLIPAGWLGLASFFPWRFVCGRCGVFFGGLWLRVWCALVSVCSEVLHDEGNAAVGGVERIVEFAEMLIGESADLGDLVRPDAAGLHETAGSVGAVGGEFPVTVVAEGAIGFGVGVAFDEKRVGQRADFAGQSDAQLAAFGV